MTELVIVTAWRRPDFLSAALQRLLLADDGRQRYMISLDRGHARECEAVAAAFIRRVRRAQVRRRVHRYRGNSFNVLTSYREALTVGPELVHLVEDDVFVTADYFEFHRRAHELAPDAFAVSACRNQQFAAQADPPTDDDAVYTHLSYQSLGVSFRPERLAQVVHHATPAYYTAPVAYCRRHWPNTAINPNNAEQDGLIHRLVEATGRPTLYPFSPRAYHAGFVGYHRKGQLPGGMVEQRATKLLRMTTEELNAAAHTYPDHVAVDLDAPRKPVDHVAVWPT